MSATWKEIQHLFQNSLVKLYPKEEINSLFFITIEAIATINRSQYIMEKDTEVSTIYLNKLESIHQQLLSGRPIQHILGKAYFYGIEYEVNEHTLIPRPETEELVHKIVGDHKTSSDLKIIDIGTGTGCIPISLKKSFIDADLWAIDISNDAIQVAKRNSINLGQEVNFIVADILEWEYIFSEKQYFDIIVSNPPYITPQEKEEMHLNVLAFEPHSALFVEESAPLLFYDYIADFAKHHLASDGTLYFEINQYLSQETADLLVKKGFHKVEIIKDINGADRIIQAKLP